MNVKNIIIAIAAVLALATFGAANGADFTLYNVMPFSLGREAQCAATADGVKCAFANTWWGKYGTMPNTAKEAANQMEFISNPNVLLSDSRRNRK